ncbi:MAG: exonuclease SbcCD subunit D [Anaerolineales bacterium]
MPNPIRMLHFADLHVGMENYGRLDPETGTSSRVRDFLNRLDEVIAHARDHNADLVVFAGDAFKTRDPDPTQQREFAHRIKQLADEVPLLLLVGNHDLPGMAVKATSLDIFNALDVPNVIVGHNPAGRVVETRSGPLYLAWMPYPMRNRLLVQEHHRSKSVDELDIALQQAVADMIAALAEEAAQHDMPRVLSGHFSVAEAKLGSERSVMLGRDVAVHNSALAEPVWDYVALGHIHKHQDVNGGRYPGVVYSGSLERIDFGEENEEKGFCWVELMRGETRWQFVPVEARPFITIRADVRETEDPTATVTRAIERHTIDDAVVRLLVQLRADQATQLRDRDLLAAMAAAYSASLSKEIEYEARARIGGLAAEAMTPAQLVERYFVDKGYDAARVERLVQYAAQIFEGISSSTR